MESIDQEESQEEVDNEANQTSQPHHQSNYDPSCIGINGGRGGGMFTDSGTTHSIAAAVTHIHSQ